MDADVYGENAPVLSPVLPRKSFDNGEVSRIVRGLVVAEAYRARRRQKQGQALFLQELVPKDVARSTFQLPEVKPYLYDMLPLDEEVAELLKKQMQWAPPSYLPTNPMVVELGLRVEALRTDRDGNCLLHAVSLALWGGHDRSQVLRDLMVEVFIDDNSRGPLEEVWKVATKETAAMGSNPYTLEDDQLRQEWDMLLRAAKTPGAYLSSFHCFVLANALRRPLVVYADRYLRGVDGNKYAPSDMLGVYLPAMLDPALCYKKPVAVGYTCVTVGKVGHFSALVGVEGRLQHLPLVDEHGSRLPLRYGILGNKSSREAALRSYIDVVLHTTPEGKKYRLATMNNLDMIPEARKAQENMIAMAIEEIACLAENQERELGLNAMSPNVSGSTAAPSVDKLSSEGQGGGIEEERSPGSDSALLPQSQRLDPHSDGTVDASPGIVTAASVLHGEGPLHVTRDTDGDKPELSLLMMQIETEVASMTAKIASSTPVSSKEARLEDLSGGSSGRGRGSRRWQRSGSSSSSVPPVVMRAQSDTLDKPHGDQDDGMVDVISAAGVSTDVEAEKGAGGRVSRERAKSGGCRPRISRKEKAETPSRAKRGGPWIVVDSRERNGHSKSRKDFNGSGSTNPEDGGVGGSEGQNVPSGSKVVAGSQSSVPVATPPRGAPDASPRKLQSQKGEGTGEKKVSNIGGWISTRTGWIRSGGKRKPEKSLSDSSGDSKVSGGSQGKGGTESLATPMHNEVEAEVEETIAEPVSTQGEVMTLEGTEPLETTKARDIVKTAALVEKYLTESTSNRDLLVDKDNCEGEATGKSEVVPMSPASAVDGTPRSRDVGQIDRVSSTTGLAPFEVHEYDVDLDELVGGDRSIISVEKAPDMVQWSRRHGVGIATVAEPVTDVEPVPVPTPSPESEHESLREVGRQTHWGWELPPGWHNGSGWISPEEPLGSRGRHLSRAEEVGVRTRKGRSAMCSPSSTVIGPTSSVYNDSGSGRGNLDFIDDNIRDIEGMWQNGHSESKRGKIRAKQGMKMKSMEGLEGWDNSVKSRIIKDSNAGALPPHNPVNARWHRGHSHSIGSAAELESYFTEYDEKLSSSTSRSHRKDGTGYQASVETDTRYSPKERKALARGGGERGGLSVSRSPGHRGHKIICPEPSPVVVPHHSDADRLFDPLSGRIDGRYRTGKGNHVDRGGGYHRVRDLDMNSSGTESGYIEGRDGARYEQHMVPPGPGRPEEIFYEKNRVRNSSLSHEQPVYASHVRSSGKDLKDKKTRGGHLGRPPIAVDAGSGGNGELIRSEMGRMKAEYRREAEFDSNKGGVGPLWNPQLEVAVPPGAVGYRGQPSYSSSGTFGSSGKALTSASAAAAMAAGAAALAASPHKSKRSGRRWAANPSSSTVRRPTEPYGGNYY